MENDGAVSYMKRRHFKLIIIIITILFSIPIPFAIYSHYYRDIITIGIVITNDTAYEDAKTASDALNTFDEYFQAEVLDIRFNESVVRTRENYFLTDDYFNSDFADSVRQRHDVDVIYILTNRFINNWLGNGKAYWGEADTKNAMCIGTVVHFPNATIHEKYINHLVVHEVLHLLGYMHHYNDRNCYMQYAVLDNQLCPECSSELPYRAALWRIGTGYESGRGMMYVNVALHIIFSTPVIGSILVANLAFNKYLYKRDKISPNPMIFAVGGLFWNIMLISALIHSHNARVVSLISFIFIYLIIESVYFEKSK